MIRPGSQSDFQFIPKVSAGIEVRALCSLVKFFYIKLFLFVFINRGIFMLKQEKGLPQTVATKLEA